MNGAESLVRTLVASGVNTCFANPGTSEMHFVAALDRVPGIRCVLALFEGVATGAADGYGRLAGRPAATLLHCGPGLANGPGQSSQCAACPGANRQHCGRPGNLSPALRRSAHRRYRRMGGPGLGLDADSAQRQVGWRRCRGSRAGGRETPAA
jgi:Thiamine pyrophosphate enzyme, N-terminal TPP binding domain